jgi:DNA-binding response OmpR family regulator
MPVKDGPTATAELRAMGYNGPIFGVTGNGLTSDMDYFLSSGADKVLLKPLDMSAFKAAMKEISNKTKISRKISTKK